MAITIAAKDVRPNVHYCYNSLAKHLPYHQRWERVRHVTTDTQGNVSIEIISHTIGGLHPEEGIAVETRDF